MPMRPILPAFALIVALAACSGSEQKESRAAIESRLDDIEELEGSVSDEMIATEASTIEAPTDGGGVLPGEEAKTSKADDKAAADVAGATEDAAKSAASTADTAQPGAPTAKTDGTANGE